jgi:serine/threonine-protein phosphatase 2A regulatory subunit B'
MIACYSNQKHFSKLTRECHQALLEGFAANVFRPLPKIPEALLDSPDAVIEETAWPHLSLIYLLFLQFLSCSIDPRFLQYHLTEKFFISLFAVLDFPDARERSQVTKVITTIFEKVPPHHATLRTITLNLLVCVSDSMLLTSASSLIGLLDLFARDIPPPMSPQMTAAFDRVLLPLHLPSRCSVYFDALVRCALMMVRKDARLGSALVAFLGAHWPMTLDHKAQLFIAEVRQLLDESFDSVDGDVCDLLQHIALAAESPCARLANAALDFLADNNFQNLYSRNPDVMLRIVFPAVYRIAEGHWQSKTQVKGLTVMRTFLELNPDVFEKVAGQMKTELFAEAQRRKQKRSAWEAIAEYVARADAGAGAWARRDIAAFFAGGRVERAVEDAFASAQVPEPIAEQALDEAEESDGDSDAGGQFEAVLEAVAEED